MTRFNDLASDRPSPADGPTKTDLVSTDGCTVALVGLDAGQAIEPHPEPYAVFFSVLDGAGAFTTDDGTSELTAGDALYLAPGERRGLRCSEALTILAFRESG